VIVEEISAQQEAMPRRSPEGHMTSRLPEYMFVPICETVSYFSKLKLAPYAYSEQSGKIWTIFEAFP
jgi:hypothetical protein